MLFVVFLKKRTIPMDFINGSQIYQINNGQGLEVRAGTLHLHIGRISSGWAFKSLETVSRFPQIELVHRESAIQVSESDLFQTGKSDKLYILPALPSRPVVLKNSGMRILPGQNMRFFLKIPLNLQFYSDNPVPENFITEYSVIRLSDTWFGEPDDGELAFALGSYYQKDEGLLELQPWEAVCPVRISNNSGLMLEVQRFIVRVENLALVRSGGRIMTSMIEIEYKGRDQVSNATYHIGRSVHGADYQELSAPRYYTGKSGLKINFHFIKNIYHF
jgi:hypothetical protein